MPEKTFPTNFLLGGEIKMPVCKRKWGALSEKEGLGWGDGSAPEVRGLEFQFLALM